jgi:uncharacterized caspase-like protein
MLKRYAAFIVPLLLTAGFLLLTGCSIFLTGEDTAFHALIIGIDEYIDPGIADLNYCVNDAIEMRGRLLQLGWKNEEVTLLLDGEATKDAILSAIGSAVDDSTPGDYILIYFSGHGSCVTDASGDEKDGVDEAIVPVDFVSGNVNTLLLDDDLGEAFMWCATEKGVFIFDSCNSGGFIASSLTKGTEKQSRYTQTAATRGPGANGDLDIVHIPVMTASAENEDSFEYAALQHGAFTYFLLDGLDGPAADSNRDGYISIRELFDHAEIQTEQYTGQFQHPQLKFHREFLDILITR